MFRFFNTLVALVKFFAYLITYNGKLRHAQKLQNEGKIAERDDFVEQCVGEWGRYLVSLTKSEVEIRGMEKIPEGSVVFVGNHQSYFDIPVMLGYFKKRFAFVAKVELKKIPMLAQWMEIMQCTFLDRKNPRKSLEAMMEAINKVKNGYSLVIFPEGHRSKGGPVIDFKAGSFKLAFKSGAPIVPVSIDGTYHLFEENKGLGKGKVTVTIHDPVPIANMTKEEQQALPEKIRETIISALPQK